MVCPDFPLPQPFGQLVRHPLDQPARVDEDQRRAMRMDLLDELIVHRRPNILTDDWAKLFIRNFDAELHLALMANVDDSAVGGAVLGNLTVSNQKTSDLFNRLLRGAQTDALHRPPDQLIEPFQRK